MIAPKTRVSRISGRIEACDLPAADSNSKMSHRRIRRIALVGSNLSPLDPYFSALRFGCELRSWPQLHRAYDEVRAFSPSILCHEAADFRDGDSAILCGLRQDIGPLSVVLFHAGEPDAALTRLAARSDARLLALPCSADTFASTLSNAHVGLPLPHAGVDLLDIARGIVDEISNPLTSASAHLQLLGEAIDGESPAVARACAAITADHARIAATMDRIRTLARVRDLVLRVQQVAVSNLLDGAAKTTSNFGKLRFDCEAPSRESHLRGDPILLQQVFDGFCAVSVDLAELAGSGVLQMSTTPTMLRLRLHLPPGALVGFQPRRSFDPYHLNRFLRGTRHGLTLSLVRAIVRAHGGETVAQLDAESGALMLGLALVRGNAADALGAS